MNIYEETALNAYYKWLNAGQPNGKDKEFWLEAEKEIIKTIVSEYFVESPVSLQPPLAALWDSLDTKVFLSTLFSPLPNTTVKPEASVHILHPVSEGIEPHTKMTFSKEELSAATETYKRIKKTVKKAVKKAVSQFRTKKKHA